MNLASYIALAIFVVMFILIVTDKIERHFVTLGCGLLTIALVFGLCMKSTDAIMETLNVKSIFTKGFWYSAGESSEGSGGIRQL